MNLSLANETALITGVSRGIGQAIAVALGQAGAYIVGTATSEDRLSAIQADFEQHAIKGQAEVLDVANPASIDDLFNRLSTPPSILINNAAITRDNLLMRMKDEEWESVINTNLSGIYRLSKSCLRPMMKAKQGRIITITSVVGLTGNAGQANYAAAKAGVIGFTKALAREIGSRGITVNTIAPGFIETDMTRNLPTEQLDNVLKTIPLNRAGQVQDVANAVLFLASPAASYITGETLHVNGGMYMA